MENKIQGAWIVHHTDKLQGFTNAANDYENINFAGKCGLLLSRLALSEENFVATTKLDALSKAAGINRKLELPPILEELENQKLIVRSDDGVTVLGLSTSVTLEYTASIFQEAQPKKHELAVIELAEKTSDLPIDSKLAREYIGDAYKLSNSESEELLNASEQIGFVDAEAVDKTRKIMFNGNLFRRGDARKISFICSSLSDSDAREITALNEMLARDGCVPLEQVYQVMQKELFKKVHSIGLYDVNTVTNEQGDFNYVTKPSAFSKFSDSIADDAFDLAKVFVTSLTFGMTRSQPGRGRIQMISKLMQRLINGEWIGPATAIGQDYKVLELRRVVQTKPSLQNPNMFSMKLLKKEVGEMALGVITSGDASTMSLPFTSASITSYSGPEQTRAYERREQSLQTKRSIANLIDALRTGQ